MEIIHIHNQYVCFKKETSITYARQSKNIDVAMDIRKIKLKCDFARIRIVIPIQRT